MINEVPRLVYRKKTVLTMFGISASTLRRWMEDSGFPRPVQLGPRAVGWSAAKCHEWFNSRPVAAANFDCLDDED